MKMSDAKVSKLNAEISLYPSLLCFSLIQQHLLQSLQATVSPKMTGKQLQSIYHQVTVKIDFHIYLNKWFQIYQITLLFLRSNNTDDKGLEDIFFARWPNGSEILDPMCLRRSNGTDDFPFNKRTHDRNCNWQLA